MMKQIYYLFALLVSITSFTSCYDDKGNYNYTEVNEIVIDTVGFRTQYTVEVTKQLVIDPKITFTRSNVAEEDLSYEWYFFSDESSNTVWYPVSTEKKLDMAVIYDPKDYTAMLFVKDNKNNLTSSMRFRVRVISRISHGLLVLHNNGTTGDFDYIATGNTVEGLEENVRIANAFETVNGRKLHGKPLIVRQMSIDGRGVNRIYLSSDQEFLQLNGRNFSFEMDDSELFVQRPEKLYMEAISGQGSASAAIYINDGRVHTISFGAQHYTDPMIPPAQNPGSSLTGQIKLAPYILLLYINYANVPFFYDMMGKRFTYLANIAQPTASLEKYTTQDPAAVFDVNNIGKDLLFMKVGFNTYGYAAFTSGPGDLWLYIINFGTTLTGTNIAHAKHDLSALPGAQNASFFETGHRGDVFLYANNRDIYSVNYTASPVFATQINDAFPAGEEITAMKIFYFDGVIYAPGAGQLPFYTDMNGTLLYVATWNGTQGKLYEFRLNVADGTITKTPLNVFDGFGRITDMGVKMQYRDTF